MTINSENRVELPKPQILAWAREELGLEIPVVAERFKKNPATLLAWENGDESPTFCQLKELANYYKRPVPIFFLPSIPPKSGKPHDFRTLPELKRGSFTKETLLAYREVTNMLVYTRELFDDLAVIVKYDLPHWSLSDNCEIMADKLRQILGISIEQQIKQFKKYSIAQETWRDILFDHGIVVRICEMPITDARAFCLFGNDLAGIGLSNEDKEPGRIFSLFHEVCHLALKQTGVSGIMTSEKSTNQSLEQYCDCFAASFLLPTNNTTVLELIELFQGSTIDYLDVAKHVADKFKVSKYVAIRRAFDLNKIPENIYWQLIDDWKAKDIKYANTHKPKHGDYNLTQMNHIGKRFLSLVMRAVQLNHLSALDAKRILGINPYYIETSM